jgi:hypothetical protein
VPINQLTQEGFGILTGSGGGGNDSDAQAFIDAAGITGATQQSALNQLVLDLKGTGNTTNNTDVWSDIYALYPFCPIDGSSQTLTAYSYNLINTANFQVTWHNTPAIDSVGVTFNGSNQYGDTGFDYSSDWDLLDSGITFVKVSDVAGNGAYMGAYDGGTDAIQMIEFSGAEGGNVASLFGDKINFTQFFTGTNTIVRRSLSDLEGYEDGASIGVNTTTISTPSTLSANISLAARSGSFYKNCKLGGGNAIHQGLTDNQVQDLADAINTFNTALGR